MMTVQQAFDLALQHHQAGRLVDAEAACRQVLAVLPNHADALHLLGIIAQQVGRPEMAVGLISRAIVLHSNDSTAQAKALNNLGVAFTSLGRIDEGISACRRALRIEPNFAECSNNLGAALAKQGQLDEAQAAYQRALQLDPNYAEAWNNFSLALVKQGLIEDGIAAYRRILQIKPMDAGVQSSIIFTLQFAVDEGRGRMADEQQRWNRQFGEPLRHFVRPTVDRSPERRLRIGYVSPDFCDHIVGRNLLPLFKCHHRQDFEILCYSGVFRPDNLTEEFRRCADQWRSTAGVADESLAKMIHEDGVDILVDLSQHTAGNRLPMFACKPAPVQVSFAGYPESTGVEAIEYRISDRWVEAEMGVRNWEIGWKREPELRSSISELRAERAFLVDSFWCYDPCGMEIAINELPAKESGQVTFGSLNNFCKVNEPLLRLWARVLNEVNESRLVILSGFGSHRQRTLEFLDREGVAAERVEFVEPRPRKAYLELYHRLDIVLDTFPYNGHTTSLDALWMGVPVVSLASETRVSRGGLSVLSNLGLPELVAHSEDEYVEIAARLAGDLPRVAELRRTLRARMEASVLMDAPRFARNIEAAYRAMWRRWCAESVP